MTVNELARIAGERGIDLGRNPVRTIRYYTSIGLLDGPRIEQVGKTRVAQYDEDCLDVLDFIGRCKSEGLALESIKGLLQELVYWSRAAAVFVESFDLPLGVSKVVFREGDLVTKGSAALFMDYLKRALAEGVRTTELLDSAFVTKDGNPIVPLREH